MLYMVPEPDKVLELRRVIFSVSRKGGSARNADPRQVHDVRGEHGVFQQFDAF